MIAVLLFLVLVAVALGIIGFVAKSVFFLFLIGCAIFVVTIAFGAFRATRRKSPNR